MSTQNLEIRRSSASVWGGKTGLRSVPTVSRYIDTNPCIGCKACEAACQEWNDLGTVATQQTGTYQTLPTLHSQYWNLIRFSERDFDGGIAWLMRKDQCMHCDEPGCLAACPAPGAIVQYANGIVDVNPDQCIGCGYCETGCPFDVPRFHQTTGFKEAALYNPPGVGGTGVVTVIAHGDHPEWYNLPADPHVPLLVKFWKSVLRPLGVVAIFSAVIGAFGHFTKYGRKQVAGTAAEDRNLPPE